MNNNPSYMVDKKLIEEKLEILTRIKTDLDRLTEINPVLSRAGYRKLYMSVIFDQLILDTSNEECLDIATYFSNRFKNMVESINNDILAMKEYNKC